MMSTNYCLVPEKTHQACILGIDFYVFLFFLLVILSLRMPKIDCINGKPKIIVGLNLGVPTFLRDRSPKIAFNDVSLAYKPNDKSTRRVHKKLT